MYAIFFFLRRFTLIFLLIIAKNQTKTQAFFYLLLTLIKLIQLFENHPYRSTLRIEQLNECTVLAVTYILFAYTDWTTTVEFRYNIGWLQIAIMITSTLVNFGLMLAITPKEIAEKLRLMYGVRNLKRMIKEAKQRRENTVIPRAGGIQLQ